MILEEDVFISNEVTFTTTTGYTCNAFGLSDPELRPPIVRRFAVGW